LVVVRVIPADEGHVVDLYPKEMELANLWLPSELFFTAVANRVSSSLSEIATA
jgi:hypothetical protein